MLRLAIGFLLIAILAECSGLFRTEAVASEVAWVLFVVFLVLAVLSMVVGRRAHHLFDESDSTADLATRQTNRRPTIACQSVPIMGQTDHSACPIFVL